MSWVIAHAFNSDLTLDRMLGTLSDNTDMPWRPRDSDLWGEYISAAISDIVLAKIFIEDPGFLLELKFFDDSLRDDWEHASQREFDKILPLIRARDVRRAPANN